MPESGRALPRYLHRSVQLPSRRSGGSPAPLVAIVLGKRFVLGAHFAEPGTQPVELLPDEPPLLRKPPMRGEKTLAIELLILIRHAGTVARPVAV